MGSVYVPNWKYSKRFIKEPTNILNVMPIRPKSCRFGSIQIAKKVILYYNKLGPQIP